MYKLTKTEFLSSEYDLEKHCYIYTYRETYEDYETGEWYETEVESESSPLD